MQSVESSVCSASFDCDDLVIEHGSIRPADLFDHDTKLPHFIFTPTGSTICAYSPNRLHCQFANGKQFSWTPSNVNAFFSSLENWPLDAPQSWIIAEATFLPSTSFIVVLFVPSQNLRPIRSLLCLLNLSDEKSATFTRVISLRGRAEAIHAIAVDRESISPFDGIVAVAFERGLLALVASQSSLNTFHYLTPRGESIAKLPSSSVRITLLQYVPQIKSLVVGFNFGGWEMWSLTKLQLM
ncbi:unnamed protein product [Hydatigera taeniaeformis]|uniref:Nucleoporin_N domain-containing protein n=1 Tax=Hydatigena taeniaeformis TaxID=6205 RepID=A0A0R3WSA8_HYDTA|nr:unnamed protein product [Hydatigera taeniaeformis]